MLIQKKLDTIIQKNNSLLCIGLDPEMAKLPEQFKTSPTPQFDFNKKIIDATADLVCTYKPNPAFYEARGEAGVRELKLTCDYIRTNYPDIFLLVDLKRGDIGNTMASSAAYGFDYLHADAVTLNPYLGGEALRPFLERKDKGSFILCRTSNPGAGEFQDLLVDGEALYKIVTRKTVTEWNKNHNCFIVAGATYPEELGEIRRLAGDTFILTPGVNSQGGDLEKTVKAGLNSYKSGLIINSSRGIIFASNGEDFAERSRKEAMKLQDEINRWR